MKRVSLKRTLTNKNLNSLSKEIICSTRLSFLSSTLTRTTSLLSSEWKTFLQWQDQNCKMDFFLHFLGPTESQAKGEKRESQEEDPTLSPAATTLESTWELKRSKPLKFNRQKRSRSILKKTNRTRDSLSLLLMKFLKNMKSLLKKVFLKKNKIHLNLSLIFFLNQFTKPKRKWYKKEKAILVSKRSFWGCREVKKFLEKLATKRNKLLSLESSFTLHKRNYLRMKKSMKRWFLHSKKSLKLLKMLKWMI